MNGRSRRLAAFEELNEYAAGHTTPASPALVTVAQSTRSWSEAAGVMMIDANEGQLLRLLACLVGAVRVLEVGTFSGYSSLAIVEALPPHGHIDTLEVDSAHAAKANEHIVQAGEQDRISVHLGLALDTLERLEGPYDMAFIDADKSTYTAYYERIVPLMRPGGLIVADNVFRHGRVLETDTADPSVTSVQDFNDRAASDPRVDAVMLTVRDGVSLIRVRD